MANNRLINFLRIDYDDILNQTISYIQSKYQDKYTIQLYRTDAGRMILDAMNYIINTLVHHVDVRISNLTFEDNTDPVELLKLIRFYNYTISTNSSSIVQINASFLNDIVPAGDFIIPRETQVVGYNSNNQAINFYIRNSLTDYFSDIRIAADVNGYAQENFSVNAYSGEHKTQEVDRTGVITTNFEEVELNDTEIIQGSERIFYIDSENNYMELQRFDSFVNLPPDFAGIPYYVEYDFDYSAVIKFGSTETTNVLPDGGRLMIHYLVGGGIEDNILANTTKGTLSVTYNGSVYQLSINNTSDASGGKNGDTVDTVKVLAPQSLFTLDGTLVKSAGYEYYLKKGGYAKFVKVLDPQELMRYHYHGHPLFFVELAVIPNKEINTIHDLRLSKQVDEFGNLVGGEAYQMLSILEDKKINQFNNILVPSVISDIYISVEVRIEKFVDSRFIENKIFEKLYNRYSINSVDYENRECEYGITVDKSKILYYLQKDVEGIQSIKINSLKIMKYIQTLDEDYDSEYFFGYVTETPEELIIEDDYQATLNEFVGIINADSNIVVNVTYY